MKLKYFKPINSFGEKAEYYLKINMDNQKTSPKTTASQKGWKNKKGQTIWIVPYIKGKGILINKNYEVKQ